MGFNFRLLILNSNLDYMELPELDESAFKDLREHLSDHNIQINKYRKGVGDGRSQCFGIVRKRSLAPDLSRCSWNDPKLHYLLMKFAREHVDIPFTSIQVNDSLKCAAHKDKHNIGNSYIVAFGPYQGGELVISGKDYNIKHRPMLFDGGKLEHSTKDFTGRRWSLVFHTQESPTRFPASRKLTDYEAVFREGQYVIAWYREGLSTEYLHRKNGLDHPLKGRKKVLPPAPVKINPKMSEAQNLILSAQSHRGDS